MRLNYIIFGILLIFIVLVPTLSYASTPSLSITINETVYDSKTYNSELGLKYNLNSYLQAYYPFENIIPYDLDDYSGNKRKASCTVCPTYSNVGGFDGRGAFIFNGAQYINVPSIMPTGATGYYTKTAWVKRSAGAYSDNIISGTASHAFWAPTAYGFQLSAGHNGIWNQVQDPVPLTQDVWFFVAVTYDPTLNGGTLILYKNGQVVSSATSIPTQNDNTIQIGAYGSGNNYIGTIDEARIYNRTLSAEEIKQLYLDRTQKVLGKIIVRNINPQDTISDITLTFDNTSLIGKPSYLSGPVGNIQNSSPSTFTISIPQLRPGNISIFTYQMYLPIPTPLNYTTVFSNTKVLAGTKINLIDTITNTFQNAPYQNGCIYNIIASQRTQYAGNSSFGRFIFAMTTGGSDAGNVNYASNSTQNWKVLNSACLNTGISRDINYNITTPTLINNQKYFTISNTTLTYLLNATISKLRLKSVDAVGDANLTLRKQTISLSHPTLYKTNVTWKINGSIGTNTSLNYLLKTTTFWVSKRNVDGVYTNISKIATDSLSGKQLNISYSPNYIFNKTRMYLTSPWYFNFSDKPTPITWMTMNFTLNNDGTQIKNRSYSFSKNNTIYFKEIRLISGYFLSITKKVTAINTNKYQIYIEVYNKGSLTTPSGSPVVIYDFVPGNFTINGTMNIKTSTWYSTSQSNNSIAGIYSGSLYRWALIPTNIYNTSLDKGPAKTSTNTWTNTYNISGSGDYKPTKLFITGLDPTAVEGAGSTQTTSVQEYLGSPKSSFELINIIITIAFGLILIIA